MSKFDVCSQPPISLVSGFLRNYIENGGDGDGSRGTTGCEKQNKRVALEGTLKSRLKYWPSWPKYRPIFSFSPAADTI